MDVLKSIRRENRKKTEGQSTTYLATEIRHFNQTLVVLKLFLPLDRSSICFEDGVLLFALTSHEMFNNTDSHQGRFQGFS